MRSAGGQLQNGGHVIFVDGREAAEGEAARLFANAEALLTDQFIVMPLFYTESYFAMAEDVTGIQASADGTELFFATAKRATK